MTDIAVGTATVLAYIMASVSAITCLVIGILALVPSAPFEEQDVTTGVVLIVCSLTGPIALAGAAGGFIIGYIIGLIMSCLCGCD